MMLVTIIISAAVCLLMVLGVLFKPKLGFGKIEVDTYWAVPLVGALALIASGKCGISPLFSSLTADTAINHLKYSCCSFQ
jgi:hypothetical protein